MLNKFSDEHIREKIVVLIEFIKIVLVILAVYLTVNIITDFFYFIRDFNSDAVGTIIEQKKEVLKQL